ncbi:MAG: OsmC family protein [Actinomycetota bacterium]|nr:OsmC family protein [Actinomycetota bacterium]
MGTVTPSTTGAPATGTPRLVRNRLQARNEEGARTVVTTARGHSLATDEPVARGGTDTAPTPLETVVGALCGCSAVTFERAARELSFSYEDIEFEASFTLDVRGLLGEAAVRPHFQTVEVEARVRTPESHERLGTVVEVTERRCPVRNLLVDAGVTLSIEWSAVQG